MNHSTNLSNGTMEAAHEEQVSAGSTERIRRKLEEDIEGLMEGTSGIGLARSGSSQESLESGSLRRSGPSEEIRRSSSSIVGLGSYHRKTAVRMLKDYITDMKTLNASIDENVQMRIDEYEALFLNLQELYNREPDSTLTLEEKMKLVSMLFDYQAVVTPEPLDDEHKLERSSEDLEITLVTRGVPVYLSEKDFLEGGQYMESLTAALKLCETQVQKFVNLLPRVKIYPCLCAFLVKSLSPAAENSFERYQKTLGNLQNDIGVSVSDNLRNSVNFCFESLVGLARKFQVVIDLLTKCGSDDWHKSALELANVQPLLPSMKAWSEFPLTIRNCEWSMELVELAFHALEKLLVGYGKYTEKDASFKWSEHKCRMVLQIPGKQLARNNSALEKPLLHVSRDLEIRDVADLTQKLAALAEAEDENQKKRWFSSRKSVDAHGIASFLSQKLAGPPPSTTGMFLPYSFNVINPENLKYVEYLDKGMSGMVAKHIWYGMQVAVKQVRNPILSRKKFEEEAAVLGLVQHPNVVHLIGCGFIEKSRTGMLVMELMDHDLRTIIDSRLAVLPKGSSPFSPMVAIDIMLQISQAMRYLREHKILHRDLKAKNLLVNICKPLITSHADASDSANTKLMSHIPAVSTVLPHTQENYVVKLADFGLAKCLPQSSYVTTHMAGTTGWRAPEVFHVLDTEVSMEYKWPADVYSFGMTCYEILTGEMPFNNVPNHSVHPLIMAGERPPFDVVRLEVPEALKDLIRECWATDPKSRPSFEQIERRLWECKVKVILPGFERHIMTS